MKIKVMPLLQRNKNQVAKVAIEFDDCPDWQLTGFTICESESKELFVLSPSNTDDRGRTWYYFKPTGENKDELIDQLSDKILDIYEGMMKAQVK